MQYHIFLSYSRKDTTIMQRVARDMRRANFAVWTDEGIEAGSASWQRLIEQSILDSACLMCIMSPDAANSEWVREELNFARIHQKPVILLLARGDETNAIPFGYSRAQYVDIRTREEYVKNMRRMILGLRNRFANLQIGLVANAIVPFEGADLLSSIDAIITDIDAVADILPPPFEWSEIPAGKVTVDTHTSELDAYYIAKFPITVAQFAVFVNDTNGYSNVQWWDFSDDALAWRAANSKSKWPEYDADQYPRTETNWYEAIAFTRWLTDKLDATVQITLPTEQQWQRAAQGDDGRLYPWGNEYSKSRANTLKTGIAKPTPVDAFRNGISPYGVHDLCGNVYEWTLSEWDSVSMVDLSGNFDRVIRGGAWDASRTAAQVTMRNYAAPDAQVASIGFRICARID